MSVATSLILQELQRGKGTAAPALDASRSLLEQDITDSMLRAALGRCEQEMNVVLTRGPSFEKCDTIGELLSAAAKTAEAQAAGSTVPASPRAGTIPLSHAQQVYWFVHRMNPDSSACNLTRGLRLLGGVDARSVEKAAQRVAERHDLLRLAFDGEDVSGKQWLTDPVELPFAVVDRSQVAEAEQAALQQQLIDEDARRPITIEAEPPLRFTLVRFAADRHLLIVTGDRLAVDESSMDLILREMAEAYAALKQDAAPALPPVLARAVQFAVWQNETYTPESAAAALGYFEKALSGAPRVLELPTDFPRPAIPSLRGDRVALSFSGQQKAALTRLAEAHGADLATVILTGFVALLRRYSNEQEFVVGVRSPGRSTLGTSSLVGCFSNQTFVRCSAKAEDSFAELLRKQHASCREGLAHQDAPFATKLESLKSIRAQGRIQLQASFSLEESLAPASFADVPVEVLRGHPGVALEPIALELWDEPSGVRGHLVFATDLFLQETVARMAGHLHTILDAAVENPSTPISKLPLLTRLEHQQLVVDWNATQQAFSPDLCVHDLFVAQAARTPDAQAVVLGSTQLTYRELDERSNQIAHYLIGLGVGPEVRVALCLKPSLDLLAALYGVLKAGGAYVPFDAEMPAERLRFMVKDSRAKLVLTQSTYREFFVGTAAKVVDLEAQGSELGQQPRSPVGRRAFPESLAYVIYTSGSTGEPKGVEVAHRSVINHNLGVSSRFALRAGDRVLQFTPINFDAAGEEIYPPLASGATVVVRTELVAPNEFNGVIEREGLSVLSLPPSYMHEWLSELNYREERLPSVLRLVLLGGEKLLPETLALWLRVGGENVPWINVYGPTETTITAAMCEIGGNGKALAWAVLPIGQPVANAQIYILDPDLRPVPIGHPGEIFIGGAGLARGYLGRPDQTAERFIPDPLGPNAGARLYRTGDMARFLSDGRIEFLGRVDHQVKIRGFRIELGEIEVAIRTFPGVKETVVILREDSPGKKRLVAYQVPATPGAPLPPVELHGYLKHKLPDYMVPQAYVTLAELPLTAALKVDRKALPAPSDDAYATTAAYVEPRNDIERTLIELWKEILGIDRLGVNDDFFDMGGQSLAAMQVMSRIGEAFQLDIQLQEIFEKPTVAQLAGIIRDIQQQQGMGQ